MSHPSPGLSAPLTRCSIAVLALLLAACGGQEQAGTAAAPAPAQGAPGGPVDPVEAGLAAIDEADYRRHLQTLASDEFGGRAPGSPGEELTVHYLVDQFKTLGLAPGNGDSYVQEVPLTWVRVTNAPDLVIDGGASEELRFGYTTDQVVWSRRQVSETRLDGSELVFVGYGIVAPERGWDDYAGVDVRGKTVVILVNDPGYATQDPALFNGNAMTYYGRWTYKFDEAARQGAAGALIVHDTKPAAYGWETVVNSWTGKKFDMVRPNRGEDLVAVEGWLGRDAAARMFAAAGLDFERLHEQATRPGFRAVPLPLRASTRLVSDFETLNSGNVAAVLTGGEAPDEYFIYMAHWDHFGTDPNLAGDQIYNGAMDNASGTAALMEIAQAYASLPQPPRRSVLFLALTAEEQGLLGSLYYALHPLVPLERTVGGLNMDGMNNSGPTRDVTVVGLGMSDLDDYLARAVAGQERVLAGDREAEKGYYFRSDHFQLARKGVPMLYPGAGYDDRERGVEYGLQKAEEYTREHYHRVSDEYDLSWDVSGALQDMEAFFRSGLEVANGTDWPNWVAGAEFRQARDAQLQGAQAGAD